MARWRIAAGVGIVAVLAVVTAFVVADALRGEPEVNASEPVGAAASASALPTSDPDPMPELHNTGDDFDQIYRSIEDFRNWLFRNPDPQLVERIYHPDCECLRETRRRLEVLVDRGFRFASNETVIHELAVLDADESAVALKVVKEQLRQVVVDGKGEVIDEDVGSGQEAYRFLLVHDQGGWLIRDIAEVSRDLEVPVISESP